MPILSFKPALIFAALSVIAGSATAYDLVDERTYTVTTFHLPAQCRTDEYREVCSRYAGFFSTRFDRKAVDLVSERFRDADFDSGFDDQGVIGTQEVTVSLEHLKDAGIITIGAEIVASLEGEISRTYESMNLDVKKGRPVTFEEMFADPALAAMLCARKFDRTFGDYRTPLFEAISAALELGPRNYVLRHDGVELIFAAGTATRSSTPARMTVTVEELRAAGPREEFFRSLR